MTTSFRLIFLACLVLAGDLLSIAETRSEKKRAVIFITCDNAYTLWLNGQKLGGGTDWRALDSFDVDIAEDDILAIEGYDANGGKAGGLYCCVVMCDDGSSWGSDSTWRCSTTLGTSDS